MNLRQLRYLVKVVEAGSMTRASEQLFVAQPALGVQIKALEEQLGVELLVRHSRGVTPTRAGQLVYERARQILRLVDETQRDVAALSSPQLARIELGMSTAIIAPVGRDVILEAQSALPDIHIGIREDPSPVLIEAIERTEVDLIVAYDVPERPNLRRIPLAEEELLFVTAAANAPDEDAVSFATAAAHPLVLQTGSDVLRLQVTTTANRLALPLDIAYDVASNTVIKDLLMRGGVAGIMHFGTVMDEVLAGTLTTRRLYEPTLKRTLCLAWRTDAPPSERLGPLIDLLGRLLLAFVERAGAIARPLPALHRPLSDALHDAHPALQTA
jgi:LysR family transcriptional regulator, nitrogen assimilation regulatory protein